MRYFFVFIIFSFCCAPALFAQAVDLLPIQIVGAQGIEKSLDRDSYSSPTDFVQNFSGVDVQQRMESGFLQDVSIRGGMFEDTGIFLNGVSLNNPQTGHYHLSLPTVSSDIDRVDASLNSQALHFRLRDPTGNENYIRSSAGNRGFAQQVVSMTRKVNGDYHRFSAEGLRTDGLRDETDGYRVAGSYLFRHDHGDSRGTLYAAVSEKKFGENGAYAAPWYMKEQEYLKQELMMGSWTFHGDLDFTVAPYFHRTQDTFWLDRDHPSFYRNDHTSYVLGNMFELADQPSGRFIAFGYERQDIQSTNLGAHDRFLYTGEIGLKPQHNGLWRYDGGIKMAYFDQFSLKFLPRFYIGYQMSSFWMAHMKAERIFRQPSFTELYYHSPSDIGNADLGLQRSDNIEWGISYETHEFWFRSDVFIRRQKDTIDWARNITDSQHEAVNAGKVDVRGFDIAIGGQTGLKIFEDASLSYTYLDLNRESVYDISKYAFEYLRHRIVFALNASKQKWSYGLKSIFEYHVSFQERWLFGAEVTYQINKNARFFITGENILDRDYDEFRYIQGDPLFVKAGLEMRF